MLAVNNVSELKPVTSLIQSPWICIDIETGNADDDAVQKALAAWKPPTNIRDESKITERRREAETRIRERSALLDQSPLLCVALKTASTSILFNGMDASAPEIPGFTVLPCGDERGMLLVLRDWLDQNTDSKTIVAGHNIRGFDLPKLRQAYIRHRLRLPAILRPREDAVIVDTMSLFKAFSMEHRDEYMIALDIVAASLGVERPKQIISGKDVPVLFEAGKYAEVLTYCAVDAVATTRAFLLMTGEAADLN